MAVSQDCLGELSSLAGGCRDVVEPGGDLAHYLSHNKYVSYHPLVRPFGP